MRICKRESCENSLPEDAHGNRRYCTDECYKTQHLIYSREYCRNRREEDPFFDSFNHRRRRAKREGIPFELRPEDIDLPDVCPVLGIPLVSSSGAPGDNSPSLDRLVPELGYTPENVRVISCRANRIKNDASLGELRAVTSWLEEELADAS